VWSIDHEVGVGRIVDRRDLSMTNTNAFVDDFDNRCQTVGGAGSRSHDVVSRRIIEVLIDADDYIEHIADFDGGGHNHTLGTSIKMALNRLGRQKLTCALQDDLDA
jgi:hypothetical protein